VLVDFELRLRSNIGAEVSAMQSIEKHSILPTTLSLSLTLVLASAFTIVAAFSAQAETCGQLAAVKGNGVEILRMQSGRGSDQVRYAIRVQESKVAPLECDDVITTPMRDSPSRQLSKAQLKFSKRGLRKKFLLKVVNKFQLRQLRQLLPQHLVCPLGQRLLSRQNKRPT
jgi:hypothetical protein